MTTTNTFFRESSMCIQKILIYWKGRASILHYSNNIKRAKTHDSDENMNHIHRFLWVVHNLTFEIY